MDLFFKKLTSRVKALESFVDSFRLIGHRVPILNEQQFILLNRVLEKEKQLNENEEKESGQKNLARKSDG
jgi:hypothetical protein